MLTCCKNLNICVLLTLVTLIMVQATHSSLPVRKSLNTGGLATAVRKDTLQAIALEELYRKRSLQRQQSSATHPHWTAEFLAKREAEPHSAPYVVSIQMMTPDEGPVHYCAGTIINENWILTAAHCLTSQEAVENSIIVAGCHDIHAIEGETESVQLRQIDYYVTHELYLGGVAPYDIALIYTKTPLQFNEHVQPAELPSQDEQPDGYGTLYGWGNVSMTIVPKFPHKLQKANMPILDMRLCEEILAAQGYPLHDTNLCTGPLTGGVSICTADSGGPLIQSADDADAASTVIGIVSWGKMPCGQKNAPSVFVRVSAFSDWIHQIITTTSFFE